MAPRLRRPVVSFFALAFLWTWAYDAVVYLVVGPAPGLLVLGVVRAWGPLVAAGTVTWAVDGDLREWAGQVTRWRVRPRWYVVAVAFPLLWKGGLAVSGVHLLAGGSVQVGPSPWWHYPANFLVVFLFAGGLEEFGWRGFAQPRLQERYSALTAATGIGVAWALWHLPLYYLFDLASYDPAGFWTVVLPSTVVSSVALAWLYNGTGGSLLFPMFVHSLGNVPRVVGPVGESAAVVAYAKPALAVVLVVGLVLVYGKGYLAPSGPVPPVPGAARSGPRPGAGGSGASGPRDAAP